LTQVNRDGSVRDRAIVGLVSGARTATDPDAISEADNEIEPIARTAPAKTSEKKPKEKDPKPAQAKKASQKRT
jgi:hypothetical protein